MSVPGPRELLDALADLFVGAVCPGCSRPGRSVCAVCRESVSRPVLRRTIDELPVLALGSYESAPGNLVRALKDGGAWQVAGVCGAGLAKAVSLLGRPAVLVPVPSRPSAVRHRGFDHAQALAKAAGRELGVGCTALLRRAEAGEDQAGLDRRQRAENLTGVFRTVDSLPLELVLVDDVCTTGATLLECRDVLERAGHRVLGAVVVANTDTSIRKRSKG